MSILDLQAFLQERISAFDSTLDVGPGSDVDTKIIQPTLRRLGSDPYAMNVRAFLMDRLNQEFPDMATSDGDAITDLLVKPSELFIDPLVRENSRIRNNLSFRDPTILTLDEADALGANFFVARETGNFTTGTARVYFSAPQGQRIGPSNFLSSRSGLVYFPSSIQSISVNEMLFNVEGSLYYFDVNVTAEQAGDQYNIDAGELVTIAGLASAVQVTNKVRFRNGIAAEDAPTYIGRVGQSISERSLTTKTGITTQLTTAFPEMTRLNVVGFNDPEMERDVLEGGGIGPIVAAGVYGFSELDTLDGLQTKRFSYNSNPGFDVAVDFTALMGPAGSNPVGWTLTIHGNFLGVPPVQDIQVATVIDPVTLDLAEQILPLTLSGMTWELRHDVLTLSSIPGGIIFPDGPNGTVTVPGEQVHIGGCTDIHVRGTELDTGTLNITAIADDEPLLQGISSTGNVSGQVVLGDLIMGIDYNQGDSTYSALLNAAKNADTLQVLAGPGAGDYRIVSVVQTLGLQPVVTVLPAAPVFTAVRWKLVDQINIDLVQPKETRISGTDAVTIQAVAVVTTISGVSFPDYGVAPNDIFRLNNGPDAGDFTILEVTPFPSFTRLVLNRAPAFSKSNLSYSIFRSASTAPILLPMVRITSIALLDQNNQPVGSNVPYADPVGAFSTAFSHPGNGVKLDIEDALLGVIGIDLGSTPSANVTGLLLTIVVFISKVPLTTIQQDVTFTGVNPVPLSVAPGGLYPDGGIIEQINAAFGFVVAVNAGNRLGLLPVNFEVIVIGGQFTPTSALPPLFGGMYYLDSRMIRAPEFDNNSQIFIQLSPPFDPEYDVVQTLDGTQIGFYSIYALAPFPGSLVAEFAAVFPGLTLPNCIISNNLGFLPQAERHIQFGSRSFGRARLYFLEPTTIQLDQNTVFEATLSNGSIIEFQPDPASTAQIVPPLPNGQKPLDGVSGQSANSITSSSTDFIAGGIQAGDSLSIDYVPLAGSIALADPVAGLAFQTLIISLAGGPDKIITFIRDNTALLVSDVSRQGVATEVNSNVGAMIASIDSGNHLVLNPTVSLAIRRTGTANALLGYSTVTDTVNIASHAGTYSITGVTQNALTFTPNTPASGGTEGSEQFIITRLGVQRIGTTAMSENIGPAGFYFADVELVSQGTGDLYDIDANISLVSYGYRSDGYYLTTGDSNLTFSPAEDIEIHISKTINEAGTDDSLADATQLLGQNIQVNYEYSSITNNIMNFVLSETQRVVNESPLARHLIPHFIRFDMNYTGGPKPTDVEPNIETLIQALFPDQQLQVSDIQAMLTSRGATSITNPLTLFGIIYNVDRTVTLEMSQDRINVGRLAAFLPDQINLIQAIT